MTSIIPCRLKGTDGYNPSYRRQLKYPQGGAAGMRPQNADTPVNDNLKASPNPEIATSPSATNNSCSDEIKFIPRVSCKLLENPSYALGLIVCTVITLLCIARWWILRYRYKKDPRKRYLEMSEYAALASEYDDLLEGVFESDEFTQYKEDDDADSIGSILTEWSGDHAAELLRGPDEFEMQAFDISLEDNLTGSEKKTRNAIVLPT